MAEHSHRNETEERPVGGYDQQQELDIGDQLRSQRKARGISLVEVAEHTKIGKKYLEALEEGRYEQVPGETYIRGFLKAYAKYLEMDDELLLRHYREKRSGASENREHARAAEDEARENNQTVWIPLLAMLVLAGVGAGFFLLWPSTPEAPSSENPALADTVASPEVGAAPLVPRMPGPNEDLSLRIRARDKAWVTVMADGRQEPDVTLNSGDERSWVAKDRFVLWTGNAGGIEIYFNGELQPALGQTGEVRKEVVFERRTPVTTPEGVE